MADCSTSSNLCHALRPNTDGRALLCFDRLSYCWQSNYVNCIRLSNEERLVALVTHRS